MKHWTSQTVKKTLEESGYYNGFIQSGNVLPVGIDNELVLFYAHTNNEVRAYLYFEPPRDGVDYSKVIEFCKEAQKILTEEFSKRQDEKLMTDSCERKHRLR